MAAEPTMLTLALMVCTLTLLVTLGKFVYFQLFYHYSIKQDIMTAVQNVAGWVSLDKEAIADSWDTQLVNVLEYMQKNEDSGKRLEVLDEESEKYVQLQNFNTARTGYLFLVGLLGLVALMFFVKHINLQPRTMASGLLEKMKTFWAAKQ